MPNTKTVAKKKASKKTTTKKAVVKKEVVKIVKKNQAVPGIKTASEKADDQRAADAAKTKKAEATAKKTTITDGDMAVYKYFSKMRGNNRGAEAAFTQLKKDNEKLTMDGVKKSIDKLDNKGLLTGNGKLWRTK